MLNLPRYPTVFEINTWVWLSDLKAKFGSSVDLGCVPPAEWDAIGECGFDAVWLMGVWQRSPAGAAVANRNESLLEDFRKTLPDFRPEDNVGSAYCIQRYAVDRLLGGTEGLALARRELARRGMNLILDFVPNHVAPDHPWTAEHPEYFIQGDANDAARDPASFMVQEGKIFAHGRDPYFPAWQDVLQLNAFQPGLRHAVVETISSIAGQCDGIRCDMAMLMLNQIFERTWGERAGPPPPTDYWRDVIPAVKLVHPGFLFMAEAYWDLEWELQQQGFDFCYDKRLYDRLNRDNAESIRLHLCGDLAYQNKLVRFIENHDEPRAAAVFSPAQERAAVVVMATVPGARLFYEGQIEGRKVRPPVFLGRRSQEPVDKELKALYIKLLKTIHSPLFREGRWSLCERTGWPDNSSFQNLVAWSWTLGESRCLVAVNLSDKSAQAHVRMPWDDLAGENWLLSDALSSADFERNGNELQSRGLFVDLAPWSFHFLQCHPARQGLVLRAA